VVGDHIRQLPPPPEVQIGDEVARQVLADATRAINAFAAVQAVPASVLDTDPAVLGMADPVVCEAIA
jgi:hypothetical protein